MKQLTTVTLLIYLLHPVFLQSGNAQDRFIWQDGERISLQVSNNHFVVHVPDSLWSASQYGSIVIPDLMILGEIPLPILMKIM